MTQKVSVAALAVVVSALLAGCGQPGGDPGGRVLRELEPVTKAVPHGSTAVVIDENDSTWQNKCPDNPGGHSGWSEVLVSVSFTTALPAAEVISDVDTSLTDMSWRRHDTTTPQHGVIARWTKDVGVGNLATAFVYPLPSGSQNWFLTGGWNPPGFALPAC